MMNCADKTGVESESGVNAPRFLFLGIEIREFNNTKYLDGNGKKSVLDAHLFLWI